MRFEVKEKKRSKQMTPKQAVIWMPILGIGMTLAFGWGIVGHVQLLSDHEIVQAEVTDTRRTGSGRRSRSKTRIYVDYQVDGEAYRRFVDQPRRLEVPGVGDVIPLAVRPGSPKRIVVATDGWKGRLRSDLFWMGLFVIIFDAAFIAVFRDARRRLETA